MAHSCMQTSLQKSEAELVATGASGLMRRLSSTAKDEIALFERTKHSRHLGHIVHAVVSHYIPTGHPAPPLDGTGSFAELGIDSLSKLELALTLEDALRISFDFSELRELNTITDFERAITVKCANVTFPEASCKAEPGIVAERSPPGLTKA